MFLHTDYFLHRFPLISPEDLDEKVQTVSFMQTDPDCMKLLFEASRLELYI